MALKLQFKFWLCHYFMATFNVVIYCMRDNSTCTHSFFIIIFTFFSSLFKDLGKEDSRNYDFLKNNELSLILN